MKIYVDMDGVLANFTKGLIDRFGDTDMHYAEMTGTDFYDTLDKFQQTDTIIKVAHTIFGEYRILTAPLRNDYENSAKWKNKWVRDNLDPQPVEVIVDHKKYKYAEGNILIDDRSYNVDPWIEHGGYGILFSSETDTIEYLLSELNRIADGIKR